MRRFTLVSFHAHPDDEVLLTGGTLARAAAEGHTVILAVATAGEAGLAAAGARGGDLGATRLAELRAAAAALGVPRVVPFGFRDSGWRDSAVTDPDVFSALDAAAAAEPLIELLRSTDADVLTTYDPAGGYGHPDHVQVHRVGALAARAAGTPSVLEATIDRDLVRRATRLVSLLPRLHDAGRPTDTGALWTPRSQLTHRVDVRAFAPAKRAAMRAHLSQASSEQGTRTLRLLLRLPRPVFDRALGQEWFVDRTRPPGRCDDVFAAVRSSRNSGGR